MTLLLPGTSLSRLIQVARAEPIAVPSVCVTPTLVLSRAVSRALWSVVRGHCVRATAENTTNPIRSSGRWRTNWRLTAVAAATRLG